ncbi:MAG: putative enoyl-CoA hydratase [Actinomycetia bacterium]|nr:putative enoyl-CoA hydratase [Actinomycetes bacterium]
MSHLTVERRDRVAVVTLDDPKRRNALSGGLVAEVVATFDELEADDGVGAVVVTGAPPAFCAGADLGDLSSAGEGEFRAIYEGFLRVARSTLPTVAAVNGPAVGAGMNLALSCDVRIAAHTARFDVRFLDLGIHPGGGHTWLLQRAIGPEAAAAMVLFGQVVDGRGAERIGLVWRSVEPDDLLDEAVVVAANAASNPKPLLAAAKQTMAEMAGIDSHAAAVERELTTQVWSVQQGWIAERLRK